MTVVERRGRRPRPGGAFGVAFRAAAPERELWLRVALSPFPTGAGVGDEAFQETIHQP